MACSTDASQSGGAEISREPLVDTVLLTGEVRTAEAVELLAPMVGMWPIPIQSILENGTEVKAGQAIAEFDNSNLIGGLEQSRERVKDAESTVLTTRARLQAEESDAQFEVQNKELALEKAKVEASIPQGLQSEREYQERQLALRTAELDYQTAKTKLANQLSKAEAELGIARVDLGKARTEVERTEQSLEVVALEAPSDGILEIAFNRDEGRPYRAGDQAQPGQTIALFPDYKTLRIEAQLFDVDQGSVETGAPATVYLDAYPERPFVGSVVDIQEVAQEVSSRSSRRVFRLIVDLENADPTVMKVGMSAKVEVESVLSEWRGETSELVPREALEFSTPANSTDASDGATQAVDSGQILARIRTDGGRKTVEVGRCSLSECIVREVTADADIDVDANVDVDADVEDDSANHAQLPDEISAESQPTDPSATSDPLGQRSTSAASSAESSVSSQTDRSGGLQ